MVSVAFGSVAVASVASPAVRGRPCSPFLSFLDRFPVAQIIVPTPRESIRVDSTFGLLDRFWRIPAIADGMELSYEYTVRNNPSYGQRYNLSVTTRECRTEIAYHPIARHRELHTSITDPRAISSTCKRLESDFIPKSVRARRYFNALCSCRIQCRRNRIEVSVVKVRYSDPPPKSLTKGASS